MINQFKYTLGFLFLMLIFVLTVVRCENINTHSTSLNITLVNTEIYHLELGTFGDEEGTFIIEDAQHAISSKLIGKPWEVRTYEYIPDSNYIGNDFVKIRTERGSDGASQNTQIEVISINFKIVE